ncbi:DVU0259 family response regulator domain-containing protein [Pseudodesulfovibrio piezophilus]|uniref:Response regulator receiver protein n=1 Tax=Pseudodesulfovibrio piezophilus (strain DSM 21447 / JCM 15486 / C1TLV30) TaxID=1322246 RepID=M1WV56_PSEP2|nr:response regulator [Pseudodesulfovibrio piezophilus]CCH48178.1 Response regulator receiver protein [Pseudodesulfovibrio piezophilus C1TLV30]
MSRKILIIDDDPYIVKYLEDILQDDGFETCAASNVEDALALLKKEKPDLITLDLEMPNEWGPRFYRKMVQEPDHKDTPVIVVSGLSGIHLAIKNAVASFKKPFNPQELLGAIRSALEA